jgi:nicotinate-nucleotide adenylyltransferase
MPQPLAQEYDARRLLQPLAVHLSAAGGIATHPIAALDISGSMIRDSLARHVSPRYLLPDAVLDYVRSHNLYVTQEVNEAR